MPDTMTITEALAEIKTIGKRVAKKREFIGQHIMRDERAKDPLEKDGGQPETIRRELQAIGDLHERTVRIRSAIQSANSATTLTVGRATRTIADWLVWRREVYPARNDMLNQMAGAIERARREYQAKGMAVRNVADEGQGGAILVNLDESALAAEREDMETVYGTLDGKLSLVNATTTITV